MAIIGKIRENTRLLIIVVALGLLFFTAREFVGASSLSTKKNPIVGSVAGKDITLRAYQAQLEQFQRNYLMSYQQTPSEGESTYLRKQVWKQLVNDVSYEKVCRSLDIHVSDEELIDMVQGDHIHPDLQAAFIDPTTKQFSKKDLLAALQNLSKLPPANQAHWYQIEKDLAQKRCQAKFQELMKHSVFVTTLEAQQKWIIQNTSLDIEYLYVPYRQKVEDNITVTEPMLKTYLQQHPNDYQVEESKEITYVTFPIVPSDSDILAFHEELKELKQEFIQTSEDKLFASTHTDVNSSLVSLQCSEKDLPTALLSEKTKLRKGIVIGPVKEEQNIYKLYKITSLLLKKSKQYEITVIEKRLTPSDETKEDIFRKAEDFVKHIKTRAQFDAQAKQNAMQMIDAKIGKEDTRIDKLNQVRELIRWTYNEGKVGKISPVFETGNTYVVAVVTGHTKSGIAPLQQVHGGVKEKVLNEQKAKLVVAKLQPLCELSLIEAAAQYGSEAQRATAQQVKFDDTYLAGIGAVNKTIRQAFAIKAGKRSQLIADLKGVILVEVAQRNTPPLPESWQSQQLKQSELEKRIQFFYLSKALDELAKVKDYRYKYY